jgi:CubicO group peptidase (beta-lactamase class C family)
VRKYLPGAPASWNPIRIRHLLTHTSGLAHDPPHYAPMPDQNCHPEVMLEPLFRMSPRTPIGLLVHHNGGGFGFGTAIYRYVDARLTVIVLTNTVWPNAPLPRNNGDAIAHAVAALYEPRLARPAN